MKFTEIAAQVLAEPAEGEEALKETLTKSGATEDQIEAAVGHYRLQQGFKDQVTAEVFGEVAKAADYAVVQKAKKTEKQEDEDEDDKKPAFLKQKKTEGMKKSAVSEEVQKKFDAKDAEIAELRKTVDAEKETRERSELVAEVEKSFSHVPGKSAGEMADMLLKARAAGGDLEQALRDQWTQTNEAVEASNLLKSGGSPLTKNLVGGAIDEMNTKARELVQKSEGGLTFDRAFVQIMDAEPELYNRYLEENPAQRQR